MMGTVKERVSIGMEFFIALGVFPIELLACQVLMVCAANWLRKLYLCT